MVYSPHDADPLNDGVNMFMEKYPNVKVEVVAAGTGELCNRIQAESANPIADVLWGGGADSLAAFKDYFEPYVCANDEYIDEAFKESRGQMDRRESPSHGDLLQQDAPGGSRAGAAPPAGRTA